MKKKGDETWLDSWKPIKRTPPKKKPKLVKPKSEPKSDHEALRRWEHVNNPNF